MKGVCLLSIVAFTQGAIEEDCKQSLSPDNFMKFQCEEYCNEVKADCPGATTGSDLATCVVNKYPYCGSAKGPEIIEDCKQQLHPDDYLKTTCQNYCGEMNNTKDCPNAKSGVDLARCVSENYSYCNKGTIEEDCKQSLSPDSAAKFQCEKFCYEVKADCPGAITGSDLATCVLNKYPYCGTTKGSEIAEDCKQQLRPNPYVDTLCKFYCGQFDNSTDCPNAKSGADLAYCVYKKYPYCYNGYDEGSQGKN